MGSTMSSQTVIKNHTAESTGAQISSKNMEKWISKIICRYIHQVDYSVKPYDHHYCGSYVVSVQWSSHQRPPQRIPVRGRLHVVTRIHTNVAHIDLYAIHCFYRKIRTQTWRHCGNLRLSPVFDTFCCKCRSLFHTIVR